ncbi:PEP-CTERM sorting domain-containing protein [Elioraea sp.]|uniref:beta strand repeat-containing protein n=1 Tax=Elioraea sp. TaxID=2185103 RepID=UPI0025BD3261|nr:PEP-CTERM sorting domain-containing protein [Elioraea sp.]
MIETNVVARAAFRVVLVASTALLPVPALAAAVTWNNTALGDWFNPANWLGGVPTTADDATVNNGGTAAASGLVTPSARSLFIGSGNAAVQTGAVTVTGLDLQIGNVFNALRVGAAGSGATATGTLNVSGSVLGLSAGSAFSAFVVGSAAGAGAVGTGTMAVSGDVIAANGAVGIASTAAAGGSSASGTLTVGGNVTGLANVGTVFGQPGDAASTAAGSVTIGGNATVGQSGFLVVGQGLQAASAATGTVSIGGTLATTSSGSWAIGNGAAATGTGSVSAGAVDTTAQALSALFVGTAANGGTGTGVLTLGTGTLTVAGNASIGTAQIDLGGTANGTVTLGGSLAATGSNRVLRVGEAASSSLFAPGTGSATGALTAAGVSGFRIIDIGRGAANQGQDVIASGTATIGAGGIVNAGDPGGVLRIGTAEGLLNNGGAVAPGPVVTGTATVAGNVRGYNVVEIGTAELTGSARGNLAVTGGTIDTGLLTVGTVLRSNVVIPNGAVDAEGSLTVTNGAISAEIVRIGIGSFSGPLVATDQAVGTATLSGSSLTTSFLEIGVLGGQGSLLVSGAPVPPNGQPVNGITANSVLVGSDGLSGNGSGVLTLQNAALTVSAAPGFAGSMAVGLNGGDGTVLATASSIGVAGALSIGTSSFDATSRARMALEASTLTVGGGLGIGSFQPGSRAELALADSTATVGGNMRVGLSANGGQLFGEALLSLDQSLLDIAGNLTMDIGAETWFGIGGTTRGLGGYGAIDALSAVLDGLITVDFAGLADFDLASFMFDLIVTEEGITSDFDAVTLLNLPTGYLASFGITGDGDIWRVTLTQATAVPEPGAIVLLLAGLAGLTLVMRRRQT